MFGMVIGYMGIELCVLFVLVNVIVVEFFCDLVYIGMDGFGVVY